jgi:hypothetical protein
MPRFGALFAGAGALAGAADLCTLSVRSIAFRTTQGGHLPVYKYVGSGYCEMKDSLDFCKQMIEKSMNRRGRGPTKSRVCIVVFSGSNKVKQYASTFAGCYQTQSGSKLTDHEGIPQRFALINKPTSKNIPDLRVKVIGVKKLGIRYRYSSWVPISRNRLNLEFNSGNAGCFFKLQRSGEDFVGKGRCGGDAGGQPVEEVELMIRRISCP